MTKAYYFFLLVNFILPNAILAQNPDKIDSLVQKLGASKGRERAATLNRLGREYLYIDLLKAREYPG